MVRRFAPVGFYGGHWGVDLGAPLGSPVRSARDGIVTFSGAVAGTSTVTIRGGGIRVSYSYLSGVAVRRGESVVSGEIIGWSGLDHGVPAVHVSVRILGRYVDPLSVLGCGAAAHPSAGLFLMPVGP